MAVIDTGSSTAGKADVDASYNFQVNLPYDTTAGVAQGGGRLKAGFVAAQYEQDQGLVFGTRTVRAPTISRYGKMSVGQETLLFTDSFNATAQNTGLWRNAVTSFTFGYSGGYVVFNSSAITTSGAAQVYQTYKTFPLFGAAPIIVDISGIAATVLPANAVLYVGIFSSNLGSTPFTPSDGVYFKGNSTGIYGAVNYAGVETVSSLLVAAANIPLNSNGTYRIIITEDIAEFWVGDGNGIFTYLGNVPTPNGNGQPMSSSAVPCSIVLQFTGVAGSAYQVKISDVTIKTGDTVTNMPFADQLNGMGAHPYQGQDGGTMGSTSNLTNSLAVGAGAAMTNTTAALGSGFGGQFTTQPTLAAGTDGIIVSWQNPAGSTTQTPHVFICTGLIFQGVVTAAFTGGPVIYEYSVAFGSTAVSLATAEGIATKAYRRLMCGAFDNFPVTSAVGVRGDRFFIDFSSAPFPINPGEFLALVAKNIGTVTSAGTITFSVQPLGYQI